MNVSAPLIAVLWQALLAYSLGIHLNPYEPPILALSVWLLYVADHVMDAQRPPASDWEPARKVFSRRHLRQIVAVGACLAAAIIPLALHLLTRATFYGGLTLGIAIALYFALIHAFPTRWRALWPRELAVAIIFTVGSVMAIWLRAHSAAALFPPTLLMAALCWLNCASIETWEWRQGGAGKEDAPAKSTRWLAQIAGPAGLVLVLLAALSGLTGFVPLSFAAAVAIGAICFSALTVLRQRLAVEAATLAADAALCSPLLVLICLWLR